MTHRKQRAVLIVAQIIMFSIVVVPIAGAVPTNDTLDGAVAVVDDDVVWTDTTGATISGGEPAPGCNLAPDALTWSVWFTFDATYTGTVRLDAKLPYKGAGLRQYMSLYEITSTGSPITIGPEVGCGSGQMTNAQDFSVTAGKQYAVAVSAVDEYLGSSLSLEFQTTAVLQGTVTDESASPLEGMIMQILTPDGYTQLNKVVLKTAADGTWEATVPTRPLVVKFRDFYNVYGTEYYDNAATLAGATTLSPVTSAVVTGIDAVLSNASSVSGTVTDTSGNPISGSYVYIYDVPFTGSYKFGVPTDANGDYTFAGLTSGDYLLKFTKPGYYTQWWNDAPDQTSATTVSTTAGTNTGYDAQLVQAARISGVVTDDLGQPISGVKVFIYDGPGSIYRSPITATDGSYIVDAVPTGEYAVYADANFAVTGGYASEWWNDLPSSTLYADTDKITIIDGTMATADFSLNRSVLSGTVTSADDGLPVEGVVVTVTNNAADQLGQTTTDANGDYSFEAFLFATPPLRLDFEATSVYFLDGQTTNISFSAGANVTEDKALDPDPQPPVADDGLVFAIAEDAPVGSTVGTVTATDPNRGDTLSWSITGGGAGAFAIDASTGAITTTTALDYETTTSYALTIEVDDGGLQDVTAVTVNVTDVDETVPPPPPPPANTFIDDDDSVFEVSIEWMAAQGITKGCNPSEGNTRFCPDAFVTRGQMAAFLVRALGLVGALDDPFVDDDDSIFEADIEKLAAAGITRGCNPSEGNTKFCPDARVTRGQMAAFLVRALSYTDAGAGDLFVDDDDSIFEADIDRLGTAGVTKGCNPSEGNTKFCPNDFVTRGQMAAFLHRALGRP